LREKGDAGAPFLAGTTEEGTRRAGSRSSKGSTGSTTSTIHTASTAHSTTSYARDVMDP